MILSQQQENIYEEDNHQESCSWAKKWSDGISPMGWMSAKQKINWKSDWSVKTMLEKQERSKNRCRSCSLLLSGTSPYGVWERFPFISNKCGSAIATGKCRRMRYEVRWNKIWFVKLSTVGYRKRIFIFIYF